MCACPYLFDGLFSCGRQGGPGHRREPGHGFEICRRLASSGLTVVLTARNETRGAEAVDRLRGLGLPDVVFHQLDITEPASAARLADFVRSKFGRLDVLVRLAPCYSYL